MITSINFTMISIFDLALPISILINIKDTKNIFSQNVLCNMLDDFMQKIVNTIKMTLAGFSQRGSHILAYNYLFECM